jgi:probable rRNA maturation factor
VIWVSQNFSGIDFDETVIHQAALATLKVHGSDECEVSILLTDDAEIQSLNAQYRQIDAPTDVLAFAMREGADGGLNPNLLGDIVISIQTAQRQAIDRHHPLEVELAWLTVHGVLHLLGYDHQTPQDAAIMFEKQETILRLI